MSGIRVVGIDLSLTCTGLAVPGYDGVPACTLAIKKPSNQRPENGWPELRRLRWMRDRVVGEVRRFGGGPDSGYEMPVLAVLEGLSYGSKGGHQTTRAGLWWMLYDALDSMPCVHVAAVAPTCRAKYATGKGNAGKDVVMREVARRFPDFQGGEDEADALVLRAMGMDHLGVPLVDMPKVNREALSAVEWPSISNPDNELTGANHG